VIRILDAPGQMTDAVAGVIAPTADAVLSRSVDWTSRRVGNADSGLIVQEPL